VAAGRSSGTSATAASATAERSLGVQRDLLEQAEVTVCRLRADQDEVVRRFTGRQRGGGGDVGDLVQQVRDECDRMDTSGFADVRVDTTGVPAAEVARLVRDRCRDWPGFGVVREQPGAAPTGPNRPAGSEANGSGGHVLLLCGPAGVGKSTIGFQLYLRCLRAGLTAAYIDLDQIGFLTPRSDGDPRNHKLKAQNLAGIWRTHHAAGARHLVMSGPIENQAVLHSYVAALPAAVITTCRLHAGPAELRRRIMTRGEGGGWPQPGDPLRGQPASYLSWVAEQAAADAQALDHTPLDALRIDIDGRVAGEAADLTAATAGWPGQGRGPEIPHHAT
jgi:hypothetical protein